MIDHCRIGSLEKVMFVIPLVDKDHCRIGSLEIASLFAETYENGSLPHRQLRNTICTFVRTALYDHCRIGSLEILRKGLLWLVLDHCRIGSLEN